MEFAHITAEEWEACLTPYQAIALLDKSGLVDREQATNWLSARASNYEVVAVAKEAWGFIPNSLKSFQYVILPSEVWRNYLRHADWKNDFWVSGDYEICRNDIDFGAPETSGYISEVRFYVDGLSEALIKYGIIAPPIKLESAPPSQTIARRDAKRKDWWDLLWLEVIRRILDDSFRHGTQADLQRWLEDYTMNELNQDIGDSTLKPMASNLFKFLGENRGKIAAYSPE